MPRQPSPWKHKRILVLWFLTHLLQRSWECVSSYGCNITKSSVSTDWGDDSKPRAKTGEKTLLPHPKPTFYPSRNIWACSFCFRPTDSDTQANTKSSYAAESIRASAVAGFSSAVVPGRAATAPLPAPGICRSRPFQARLSPMANPLFCWVVLSLRALPFIILGLKY